MNSTLKELINIKESREARGKPIKCQRLEGGREVNCVTGEGGFQNWLYIILEAGMYLIPFGWSKFELSALALKRIFWDLNGVAVVKEG